MGRGIFIGFRCRLSHAVLASHSMVAAGVDMGAPGGPTVTVEEGAWIGSRAWIAPGVRIGAWAVVAAGAQVHEDVPAEHIVIGRPARIHRRRKILNDDGPPDISPILAVVRSRLDSFRTKAPPLWTVGVGCLLDADICGGDHVDLGDNLIALGRRDGPSPAGGLDLAEGVRVGSDCVIEASGGVVVGRGTLIGSDVVILSSSHDMTCRSLPWRPAPIRIGAGCVIGEGATLVGPLVLGDRAIVPPHALVVADVPAGTTARSALN